MKKEHRAKPDFSYEAMHDGLICGLDEVGRAPLAGPVVAACVHIAPWLYKDTLWQDVNDSKILTAQKRGDLAEKIRKASFWGIGEACMREIEAINIVQASFLAMRRAYEAMLSYAPETSSRRKPGSCAIKLEDPGFRRDDDKDKFTALIDGHIKPRIFPCETRPIVKGDSKSVSIAAASIIAKVHRDAIMAGLAKAHPHYGWERNAGYPTPQHLHAIDSHGLTIYHRRSFAPVHNYLEHGSVRTNLKTAS